MMLPHPISRFFFSQHLRLHYVDWGNQDAPPLLLVHGGQDHCRNWDWVAADLARDWHVIAPDLRGHGDSDWSPGGAYAMNNYILDLVQLIHQQQLAPVSIVAHSLGGNIALRTTGIFPELVKQIVSIEGLGPSPTRLAERAEKGMARRMRDWIEDRRAHADRPHRRYPSIADAFARMQQKNKHLSPVQARHLTEHGVNQNEDGSYSWKFDNETRFWPPYDMSQDEIESLWAAITCPTLLIYGRESWASNPEEDGRIRHFRNARVAAFERAGHWVHHDRLEAVLAEVRGFLKR
jgi:pimeloyl-ACP methyl ester carboxylesterase